MAATGEHDTQAGGTDLVHATPDGGPGTLRDHLPGLEPERNVSDWGRSELVEDVLDRTLYDFLYRHWFRVEAEGVETVPSEGPVLLVANQAGSPALTAAMIAKAIRHRQGAGRPVHFAVERPLGAIPGLDMLLIKAGAVTAHPANLQRLLFDERQIVLVRPSGRVELLRAAVRARATIVPVAISDVEQGIPVLSHLPRLPLAGRLPLPGKIRLRFLAGESAPVGVEDEVARALADELHGRIEDALVELVRARRR
jgi:1-acyl-sn-glycerol-3-phosphate acyltransferase